MSEELRVALIVTFILVLVDVISGAVSAFANKTLQSSKLREGLWHKCGYAFVLFMAMVVEWAMVHGMHLGFEVPLTIPLCVWISGMEIVSTLENVRKINPDLEKIPGFDRLKKEEDQNDDEWC